MLLHYSFMHRYELDNGQIFSEAGALKEVGDTEKVPVIVVSGQYTFVGPDGVTYWVNYTADENGYHPVVGKIQSIDTQIYLFLNLMKTLYLNNFTGTGPEGGIKPGQDAAPPTV